MSMLKYAAMAAMIMAGSANAELVETDWLADSDGLATLDTNSGLEWLDLTLTDGMSINQVSLELGDGGQYEGWRLATASEVHDLMRNYFGVEYIEGEGQKTYSRYASGEQIDDWQYHFGITGAEGRSMGRYDNGEGQSVMAGTRNSGTTYIDYNRGTLDNDKDYDGVFLVSEGGLTLSSQLDPTLGGQREINDASDVPAPIGFAAAGLLLGLSGYRRKGKFV